MLKILNSVRFSMARHMLLVLQLHQGALLGSNYKFREIDNKYFCTNCNPYIEF